MTEPSPFPIVALSSLAASFKGAMAGGPFGSDLVSKDYVSDGVPVVRGTNLPMSSRFSCENFVFVTPSKADSLHLNCAKPGDLVFTQRGTLGQVGIVPRNTKHTRFLISQSQMKMTVDERKACPIYLYYYFRSKGTVAHIENIALQAGVPHINLGILRNLQVVDPGPEAQRKIGAVLAAYDDLIENNRRRIALLERMAEELYREWFVRFRFPGHRTAEFYKGIPKGWAIGRLGKYYRTASGGTPPRESTANYGGDINWVKTGELKSLFVMDTEERITLSGLENSSAKVFPRHTTVIAMYCAMPDISLLSADSATNQACCAFFPRFDFLEYPYTYMLVRHAQKHMINFAHGAAQQNLSQSLISGFPLLVAPEQFVKGFSSIAKPLFEEIEILMRTQTKLAKTRDLLLPRLISGKLRVDDLDIQFPPSMLSQDS